MYIYNLKFSKDRSEFASIYNKIEKLGKMAVYPRNIVFICDKKIDKVKSMFVDEEEISIKNITNSFNTIPNQQIVNWLSIEIAKENFEIEVEKAKYDIQERTTAMYEILVEANKKINESEVENGKQKSKTTKGSKPE